MRLIRILILSVVCAVASGLIGCSNEKTTTRKVTVEGPEKKHEVKVKTTEREK